MDGADIQDDIHWIIDRLRRSQPADFTSGGRKPRIEAALIRQLMLGFDVPGIGKVDLPGTGIRIKGAIIEGQIDLQYGCAKEGHPMPALALEACDIASPILLTSARLQRLSLRGSRICELDADYVHIHGLLNIADLHGYPSAERTGAGQNPQHLCRIGLRGGHIEDGIEARGAHLVGPRKNDRYEIYAERSAYALDLPESQINGDVRLFPDFTACGGVNINGAIINGSFHAHGAELTGEQLYAFDASGAHIHGSLALDTRNLSMDEFIKSGMKDGLPKRFRCRGQILLRNITVQGDLKLNGAQIEDLRTEGLNVTTTRAGYPANT